MSDDKLYVGFDFENGGQFILSEFDHTDSGAYIRLAIVGKLPTAGQLRGKMVHQAECVLSDEHLLRLHDLIGSILDKHSDSNPLLAQLRVAGEWNNDLTAVPRDHDFLLKYDDGFVCAAHYVDNTGTQWPWQGVMPNSGTPIKPGRKVVGWRELPT